MKNYAHRKMTVKAEKQIILSSVYIKYVIPLIFGIICIYKILSVGLLSTDQFRGRWYLSQILVKEELIEVLTHWYKS
jgi:hypothetical protein